MATEVPNRNEPSLAVLVSGIVSDIQDLVKQQLQLTRKEIEADFRKMREAASLLAFGLGVLFLGGIALCLALALLIYWLGLPTGGDPGRLPLWVAFGLVGLAFAVLGGGLAYAGKKRVDTIHPLEQTTQALEENLEWKTHANRT
jgi:hypothetical protein